MSGGWRVTTNSTYVFNVCVCVFFLVVVRVLIFSYEYTCTRVLRLVYFTVTCSFYLVKLVCINNNNVLI